MSRKPLIPLNWISDNSRIEKSNAATILDTVPQEIVLSENKANFKFSPVDAPLPHSKAQGIIQVGAYIPIGETINIVVPNITSITLTASTTPGANEFYTESSAPANLVPYLQTVIESIADALLTTLSLSNNYSVQIQNTSLLIEATSFGTEYDFTTFTSSIPTSINMFTQNGSSRYLTNDFIDYTCFANIFVCNQVYGTLVNKFESVYAGTNIVDSNTGEVNIDAAVVGNYVNHILPIRNVTPFDGFAALDKGVTSGGIVIPGEDDNGDTRFICRPYFIEFGDKFSYVKNQAKKQFTKGVSEIRWMQLGAFDRLMTYDMSQYVWNPISNGSFKWLTSCPMKTITYDSHEYLQVIVDHTTVNRTAYIELVLNFYDGTQTTANKTAFSYQDVGGNVSFDVSPVALDLQTIESNQGKLIDTYSVRINWDIDGINRGTSTFNTYKFDRNCYNDKENIIFVNEFGAWDSLEFRGSITEDLQRSIDTLERSLPFNANTTDAINSEVKINVNTDINSRYTINSGLLSPEVTDWSKKLMESSAIYIWDNQYNGYRAILITENDYIDDNSQTGRSLSITFTYTTDNNSISR